MTLVIKTFRIAQGYALSATEVAEAYHRLGADGWKVIGTFEHRGTHYLVIERSK